MGFLGVWPCRGGGVGNGKRSDPNMSPESNLPSSLLRRVLVSNSQQQINQLLGDSSQPELFEERQLLPLDERSYRDLADDVEASQSVKGNNIGAVRRYLEALRLQHELRDSSEDFK
ncbi:hypothetical protein Btru_071536 [Bulinus truncatus]|nr:hypothetical protein Btru_071536 [Bulinus truncatus]